MVSLRRTSDGRSSARRPLRALLGVLVAVVTALGGLVLGAAPAAADPPPEIPLPVVPGVPQLPGLPVVPPPGAARRTRARSRRRAAGPAPAAPAAPTTAPTNAADAQNQLDQVQRDAEALTEQWHAAQDEVDARKQEVAQHPGRGGARPGARRGRAGRRGVLPQAGRRRHDGHLRERQPRPARRPARRALAAGLPRPDVGPRDDLVRVPHRAHHADHQGRGGRSGAGRRRGRRRARPGRRRRGRPGRAAARRPQARRRRPHRHRRAPAARAQPGASAASATGPPCPRPRSPAPGIGVAALRAAASQLGKPYRWGAEGPGSYDCSGLTSWAFARAGVTLPRSSSQQALVGTPVSWNEMQPGDLVFYYSPGQPRRHLRGRREVHQRAASPATSCATRTSPARPSPALAASSPRQTTSAPQRFGGRSRVVGRRPRHGGRYGGR